MRRGLFVFVLFFFAFHLLKRLKFVLVYQNGNKWKFSTGKKIRQNAFAPSEKFPVTSLDSSRVFATLHNADIWDAIRKNESEVAQLIFLDFYIIVFSIFDVTSSRNPHENWLISSRDEGFAKHQKTKEYFHFNRLYLKNLYLRGPSHFAWSHHMWFFKNYFNMLQLSDPPLTCLHSSALVYIDYCDLTRVPLLHIVTCVSVMGFYDVNILWYFRT